MELSEKKSSSNIHSFLWHAVFLALASNFMDVDTIIPSMLIKAGGTPFHLGLLTAIMLGGTRLFQLIFASHLSAKENKKPFLISAINIRVLTLFLLALVFYRSSSLAGTTIIWLIFILITVFALSGSYAGIPYNDIFGKLILQSSRKRFFSIKQTINSIGIFLSALLVRELIKNVDYPDNYSLLFLLAAFLLFIASLGFWRIQEIPSKIEKKSSLWDFINIIPKEIKKNSNLKNYLFMINSLGLGISILPFLIMFAKDNFELSFKLIGNLLLFRTIGMLTASLIFYKISHKLNYRKLLMYNLFLGASLPIIALLLRDEPYLYQFLFILSGMFVAMYRIGDAGVLMEISNNENRVLYTGISGAGTILTTLFPLVAGFLITKIGYLWVFIIISTFVLLSFFFVRRLDCSSSLFEESTTEE
jgi:MFS family permease